MLDSPISRRAGELMDRIEELSKLVAASTDPDDKSFFIRTLDEVTSEFESITGAKLPW